MHRAFELKLKSIAPTGEFEGVASTYGNTDEVGDVCMPGCFDRTLSISKTRPLLWQHRDPIGTVELADSPAGLLAKGKFSMDVRKAKDAWTLCRDGAVGGLSIGYEEIKSDYVGDVRRLFEIKLWEVSLVTFPANERALVSSVKSINHQRIHSALFEFKRDILAALQR